jgi:hypothetical protein
VLFVPGGFFDVSVLSFFEAWRFSCFWLFDGDAVFLLNFPVPDFLEPPVPPEDLPDLLEPLVPEDLPPPDLPPPLLLAMRVAG